MFLEAHPTDKARMVKILGPRLASILYLEVGPSDNWSSTIYSIALHVKLLSYRASWVRGEL